VKVSVLKEWQSGYCLRQQNVEECVHARESLISSEKICYLIAMEGSESLQHSLLYVVVVEGEPNSVLQLAKAAGRRSVRLDGTAHSFFLPLLLSKK
jgi:hypothetical protein